MFLRKRRLKKEDKNYKRRVVLTTVVLVAGFSMIFVSIYYALFSMGYSYVNPISKNVNSFQSRVKDGLEKANIKFTQAVSNSDGSQKIKLKDGSEIIFSYNKDLNRQIASLQLLLSRLTIEDKKLKTLDFRFASPVVSFN